MNRHPGDIVESKIKDLAYDGKAVGEIDGKIIFLNAGLPGEVVRARITKAGHKYDVGEVVEIIEKSGERVPAPCPHFDICGGCTWQDLNYERQLYYKRKQVDDCLKHIAKFEKVDLAETVPAPNKFHYRNKMEFSFNTDPENGFVLGLHRRGRFNEIFDLNECYLTSDKVPKIVNWFRTFVRESGMTAYDVVEHDGFLRFLMIRQTQNTDQIMLNIVTVDGNISNLETLLAEVKMRFPEVVTVVQNINNKKSNISKGEKEIIHFGDRFIEEQILDCRFRIYANSFFQTNSLQAENLYRTAFELLQPNQNDKLLDLYCGAGTIGLTASKMVADVIGLELEPTAVDAARENAKINDIGNATFYTGLAQELLNKNRDILNGVSLIITDPPRAGMHKKVLKALVEHNNKKLVYISCNPSTFARDARILINSGYSLGKVIPVDMFPHTMHIELV
ncbi:MAG: 23S rRNA (uracil(1939)-C(5))-methyltransferase RlmD, partial [Candidatus Zixiibacteriota bacterium]